MIIPVRCFTCGKILCDKWQYYCEEVEQTEKEGAKAAVKNFDGGAKGAILDKMGLMRMCCRRHMLGHVDIVDKL